MSEQSSMPIACDLNALSPEERQRRFTLVKEFARTVTARKELPDGFEMTMDPAKLHLPSLAEWIALEQRCCPFLRFTLDIGPGGCVARIALTGSEGVKEFLRAEMSS
jgi:hypothetical protein